MTDPADNKNHNYTCLDLIWSVSDTVMHNPELNKEHQIWEQIFKKLCLSSTYPDAQVRNSSLQIYSSLLFDYGDNFDGKLWEFALYDLFFRMFDDVVEIYLNLRLQKGGDSELSAPESVNTLKSNFESLKLAKERYLT